MIQFKPNAENISLETKLKMFQPLTIEEVIEDINRNPGKSHRSYFGLPDGRLIDCRFPIELSHIGVTKSFYDIVDYLAVKEEYAYLGAEKSLVNQPIGGQMAIYKSSETARLALVTKVCTDEPELRPYASSVSLFLQEDELLVYDLSLVKIVVMKYGNETEMSVKLPYMRINGSKVTGAQRDSVELIAEAVGKDPNEVWRTAIAEQRQLGSELDRLKQLSIESNSNGRERG